MFMYEDQGWTPRPALWNTYAAQPRPVKKVKTAGLWRGKIKGDTLKSFQFKKPWWNHMTIDNMNNDYDHNNDNDYE